MAEGLLRKLLPPSLRDQVRVRSAGTQAEPGSPATPQAIATAGRKGVDLRGHRAQQLFTDLVVQSDLILGMEQHHVQAVLALVPSSRGRVHLLSAFDADPLSRPEGILDPMGGSPEIYEECLLRIERQLARILPHLEERVVGEHRS
jgi:protein-tyrosine phosphatase